MFSTVACNLDSLEQVLIAASVDDEMAFPGEISLTPTVWEAGWHTHSMTSASTWSGTHTHSIYDSGGHTHFLGYMGFSYNFYQSSVSAGTHTIEMSWKVTGGTEVTKERTLIVIALPT